MRVVWSEESNSSLYGPLLEEVALGSWLLSSEDLGTRPLHPPEGGSAPVSCSGGALAGEVARA